VSLESLSYDYFASNISLRWLKAAIELVGFNALYMLKFQMCNYALKCSLWLFRLMIADRILQLD